MNLDEFEPTAAALAAYEAFDFDQACREGWCVFESGGSENGPFQLCRIDSQDDEDGAQLASDDEAWQIVATRAREGSAYHQAALDLVAMLNPLEREWIRKATEEPR